MDTLDIALRLCAATLVGVVLGLNRDLHGKSTGVRTLGILCLGSALAVLSIHAVTGTDASRVIQGIVTGVGFLGAGVIVRSEKGHHVQGLTTAACVWVTACMGAACAVAQWQIVVIGVVLVFVILVFGGPFEKAIDRRWPWRPMAGCGSAARHNARAWCGDVGVMGEFDELLCPLARVIRNYRLAMAVRAPTRHRRRALAGALGHGGNNANAAKHALGHGTACRTERRQASERLTCKKAPRNA